MKCLIIALALTITSAAFAQSKTIYKCVDGSRSFRVDKTSSGQLTGVFYDFSGMPQSYDCKQTKAGNNFKCTKDDYIVTVRKSAQGGMMVDFELKGDFFPESGYLHSLYCE